MRLLEAISDGRISWEDLEQAVITKVETRTIGEKRYITDLVITAKNVNYDWTITGER
jgi:hypothetical protein